MRKTIQGLRSIRTLAYIFCILGGTLQTASAQLHLTHSSLQPQSQTTQPDTKANILFLHHSTGACIWEGGVAAWFDDYKAKHKTRYTIREQAFPRQTPYGWNNYPFDYWNIWVKHAGNRSFKTEPTLDMLATKYDVIIFKHCFPVSAIEPDTGKADVTSDAKRAENYRLQYAKLKKKMRQFTGTKFIVWTGAALVKAETDEATARRAETFFKWVRDTWDEPDDNIFVWDFRALETEGGLYLKDEYAQGDSHPNEMFSRKVAPLFCRRIVDVIRGKGDSGSVTGESQARRKRHKTSSPKQKDTNANQPIEPQPKKKKDDTNTASPTTQPTSHDEGKADSIPDSTATPRLLFDDAEDAKRAKLLWNKTATYERDGKNNVIRIRFADAQEEDWGEYGRQRIVTTTPATKNLDITAQRYLALRVRVERPIELVLTLITRPKGLPKDNDSHFGYSAYLHPKAGDWQWIVLDLTKLELNAEGDRAYTLAGKPTRPQHLTSLRFVTNKKNEEVKVCLDDIAFYRDLPESLRSRLSTQ